MQKAQRGSQQSQTPRGRGGEQAPEQGHEPLSPATPPPRERFVFKRASRCVRKLLQGCFCGAAQGAGRSRGWAALSWVQPSLLSSDRGLCSLQGDRAGAPHAAVGASASSRSLPAACRGSGLLRCVIKLRLKLFGAGGPLQPRACGQIQGAAGQGSEGKGTKTKAVSTQHSWAVLSRSPGAAVPQQAHKSPRQR